MGAFMGMAGMHGVLRRTIYGSREYYLFMISAGICGVVLFAAFVAFLTNIVMSVGVNGTIVIFAPLRRDMADSAPAQRV